MPKPDAPNLLRHGVLDAIVASLAFGVTAPLVQRLGPELGAFSTAALLYAGAAGFSALGGARPPARAHARTLLVVAFAGVFLAPVLLAAGLQRASGTSASLLLDLEAVFTVLLGRVVWREPVARRVVVAAPLAGGGGRARVGR